MIGRVHGLGDSAHRKRDSFDHGARELLGSVIFTQFRERSDGALNTG